MIAALPTHPHGQRRDLAEIDVRGVAQAALAGAAGQRVLDAKADERARLAAVHADRHGDHLRALGHHQSLGDAGVEVDAPADRLQLAAGHLVGGGGIEQSGRRVYRRPWQVRS